MITLDGRKWTERRIAFWAMVISLIAVAINIGCTLYSAHLANTFNQKSFCYDRVATKLETISNSLIEMPKLVMGCGVDPAGYCQRAIEKVQKTNFIAVETNHLLTEKCNIHTNIESLLELLKKTMTALQDTDISNDHKMALVGLSKNLILERSQFADINRKEIICDEF